MLQVKEKDLKHLHDLELSFKDSISLGEKKEGEKLSILSDSMMKAMFQNENRLKYSAKLLSYFLDVSYEELLDNIHLSKNELDKERERDLNRRGDYVAFINGSFVNIEVNNNGSLETFERNIEYAHRLYARKVKRKKKGNEEQIVYTQVIQLNLNNFSFVGNDKIVDIYCVQNDEELKLTDKLIFIQIYVPNLMKKWYTVGVQGLEEYERYLLALVLPNVDDSLKIGEGVLIMEEYVEEAVEVSDDEDLLEAYDKEWAMKDLGRQQGYKDGVEIGKVEGIKVGKEEGIKVGKEEGIKLGKEEGIKLGKEEGILQMAEAMIQRGLPIDDIVLMTGLSEEKIESFLK